MFLVTNQALDPKALTQNIKNSKAGGFVSFEGWVRNHNEGQPVNSLEYEVYATLAIKEAQVILNEALKKYDILEAHAAHREGHLAIGDLAVWVGIAAKHRKTAFLACEYVIDEIKLRLPIWKKEHYVSGEHQWVNCQACYKVGKARRAEAAVAGLQESVANDPHMRIAPAISKHKGSSFCGKPSARSSEIHSEPTSNETTSRTPIEDNMVGLNKDERSFYQKQIQLPQVGQLGQSKLKASKVLVIGAGGLGCPALSYLAAAGIGSITICDGDDLDLSNLHRQNLYSYCDIGGNKSLLAKTRLENTNPFIQITAIETDFGTANAESMIRSHDVVLDCTDNFEAKFLIHKICHQTKKVLVQASIYQLEGQIQLFDQGPKAGCYRCQWPQIVDPAGVGNCAEVGVIGFVPGVLGVMQAAEAIKYLLGWECQSATHNILVDLASLEVSPIKRSKNKDCQLCGEDARPSAGLSDYPLQDYEMLFEGMTDRQIKGFKFVDIRATHERDESKSWEEILIHDPQNSTEKLQRLQEQGPTMLVCQKGYRSRKLALNLRNAGSQNVFSLAHGVASLKKHWPRVERLIRP